MLAQDTVTGALYEVPDDQLYEADFGEYPDFAEYPELAEGQVVYDGLGNPVGLLPFLPKVASLATGLLPQAGRLVGGLFGRRRRRAGAPVPPLPGLPQIGPAAQAAAQLLPRFRPPWPAGWVRPPLPYTGFGPRRLYLRCAVWPGPRGLVPAAAAQMPPGALPPAAAAAAQQAAAMARRGRRRFRRRRR